MLTDQDVTRRRNILRTIRKEQRKVPDGCLCALVASAISTHFIDPRDRSRVEEQVLTMLFTVVGRFPAAGDYLHPLPHTPSGMRMRRRAVLAACRIAEADYERHTKKTKAG